ncbi:MAG: DUF2155 domain-containing protein [Alphaproteobacteria bacterium]|nr:DUF2155 domain-containing protein [Alphaproteobacteria bacterium]
MSRFWRGTAAAVALSMAFGQAAAVQAEAQPRGGALLRGLDKVTGHAADFIAPIGETVTFGALEVVARACERRPEDQTPEVSVYLQIYDMAPTPRRGAPEDAPERREIFSGWMFASSPGLNGLEHAVYDIWAMDCRT